MASLCAGNARGDVRMPAIFGDHMVLQQDVKLSVWGTADPGEQVSIAIGSSKGKATADATGKWTAKLPPLPVSATPVEMQVAGKNKLAFKDVLVGDVWLCSGQSNMEFGIGNTANAKELIPQMDYPSIRLFLVPHTLAFEPQTDIKQENLKGQWVVCTPQNVVAIGGWNGFSAVGLLFGREIHEQRKQPVGLIGSYWGGTKVETWSSQEMFKATPELAHFVGDFETIKTGHSDILRKYTEETLAKWQQDHDAWKQLVSQPLPQGTQRPKEPQRPESPDAYPQYPSVLYNGMINPLVSYGIKGVIWYQGESNGGKGEKAGEYQKTFASMIADWRQRWGIGEFPFLFVQCPTWDFGYFWIRIRDEQFHTLAVPKTGMAVSIDVGEAKEVHPKGNKPTIAHRLALAARRVAYGEKIVASGPLYSSFTVEGNKIRIHFTETGSGLMIGSAPSIRPNEQPKAPEDHLNGFEISPNTYQYFPAQALIDGDTIVVWSDSVATPKNVRFGAAGFPNPPLNLYNKEGLPASPFNTITGAPALPAAH
ncbi:MAG: sialate O-acetylesterase [Chthoniobacteraceae bacterium]|nr:sialate O-acetylesterase [Chthoniobacteraceae bacterium]